MSGDDIIIGKTTPPELKQEKMDAMSKNDEGKDNKLMDMYRKHTKRHAGHLRHRVCVERTHGNILCMRIELECGMSWPHTIIECRLACVPWVSRMKLQPLLEALQIA